MLAAFPRQSFGLQVGEKTLSDVRPVDRAELGLRALGERERGRGRRQQSDAERGREHPGHGPAILRRFRRGQERQAALADLVLPDEPPREREAPTPRPTAIDVVRVRDADELDAREHEDDPEPDPQRALGHRIERCEPISTPGIEPTSSQAIACLSTSPWSRCEMPATQSSTAAWNMSVPTIFCAVSGIGEEHREPEERPRADRGEADDEAAEGADRDRDQPCRAVERWNGASSLCRLDERLGEEAGAAEDQRAADDLLQRRHAVVADEFATSTPTSESGAEPTSIQSASRAWTVPSIRWRDGAERLEDRAVEDVGADRDLRVEAEEQDQDRRHQAAAAHPGHPDEHADERAPRGRTARSCSAAAASGRRRTACR